eukprot:TRINITY_DN1021_c0_g2_i1.p1 TRINITY_DN1021_c0_g2~~TRINITY_DN1021_c0_g2_i1.p1  ORF type:complete len:819 (+),score=175.05 TRINITY_DN1021_c0_g2_i1:254-2458(+)
MANPGSCVSFLSGNDVARSAATLLTAPDEWIVTTAHRKPFTLDARSSSLLSETSSSMPTSSFMFGPSSSTSSTTTTTTSPSSSLTSALVSAARSTLTSSLTASGGSSSNRLVYYTLTGPQSLSFPDVATTVGDVNNGCQVQCVLSQSRDDAYRAYTSHSGMSKKWAEAQLNLFDEIAVGTYAGVHVHDVTQLCGRDATPFAEYASRNLSLTYSPPRRGSFVTGRDSALLSPVPTPSPLGGVGRPAATARTPSPASDGGEGDLGNRPLVLVFGAVNRHCEELCEGLRVQGGYRTRIIVTKRHAAGGGVGGVGGDDDVGDGVDHATVSHSYIDKIRETAVAVVCVLGLKLVEKDFKKLLSEAHASPTVRSVVIVHIGRDDERSLDGAAAVPSATTGDAVSSSSSSSPPFASQTTVYYRQIDDTCAQLLASLNSKEPLSTTTANEPTPSTTTPATTATTTSPPSSTGAATTGTTTQITTTETTTATLSAKEDTVDSSLSLSIVRTSLSFQQFLHFFRDSMNSTHILSYPGGTGGVSWVDAADIGAVCGTLIGRAGDRKAGDVHTLFLGGPRSLSPSQLVHEFSESISSQENGGVAVNSYGHRFGGRLEGGTGSDAELEEEVRGMLDELLGDLGDDDDDLDDVDDDSGGDGDVVVPEATTEKPPPQFQFVDMDPAVFETLVKQGSDNNVIVTALCELWALSRSGYFSQHTSEEQYQELIQRAPCEFRDYLCRGARTAE